MLSLRAKSRSEIKLATDCADNTDYKFKFSLRISDPDSYRDCGKKQESILINYDRKRTHIKQGNF